MGLYENLEKYHNTSAYPFHMPGHKRNGSSDFWPAYLKEWFRLDITEIDGFDNLHHAEGILKEAMDFAARFYHAEKSYFLVNGSTCGILAAISAALPKGGKILMMRASHKSAYHAVLLRELQPVYLFEETGRCRWKSAGGMPRQEPEKSGDASMGGMSGQEPEKSAGASERGEAAAAGFEEFLVDTGINGTSVMEALKVHPDVQAVFLTVPTYEGFSFSIKELSEYLHAKNIPLIVDAAHGAHFGMADFLPENAVTQGADLVIHSLHKTLPAPTQTALLHFHSRIIARERVEKFLEIYETSSPSYPMMAAIEKCLQYCEEYGGQKWEEFYGIRKKLTERICGLKHIGVFDYFHQEEALGLPQGKRPEICKMLLYLKNVSLQNRENARCGGKRIDGKWLYDRLRLDYGLQPELSLPGYVLLMFSLMDTEEAYGRLADALLEIDGMLTDVFLENGDAPEASLEEGGTFMEATLREGIMPLEASFKDSVMPADTSLKECSMPKEDYGNTKKREIIREASENIGKREYVAGAGNVPTAVYRISDADEMEKEWCGLKQAAGKVCGDFISVYPPGQPILVPGEEITEDMICEIQYYRSHSYEVQGMEGEKIRIIK